MEKDVLIPEKTVPGGERAAAARALTRVSRERAYSSLTISAEAKSLTAAQTAYVKASVEGVLRRLNYIDHMLSLFADLHKTPPFVKSVLRLGAHALKFMDGEPDYAAVSEYVEVVKRSGSRQLAGFTNAVLRKLAAYTGDWGLPGEPAAFLSVRYSCPLWMVNMFIRDYGIDKTSYILEVCDRPKDIRVMANITKTTAGGLLSSLSGEGAEAREGVFPNMLTLVKPGDITRLKAFKEGLFHVMDVSSARAAIAVVDRIKDKEGGGSRVADVCASPGGKSFAIAENLPNCQILSRDKFPHKVRLIEDGARRLGLKNIKAGLCDAAHMTGEEGAFDAVLCDAPCSGLGLLRGKPDIRHSKHECDVLNMAAYQKLLISGSIKTVKPGGAFVYSVCSISREETFDIADFISNEIGAEETSREIILPDEESDGFFVASFTV